MADDDERTFNYRGHKENKLADAESKKVRDKPECLLKEDIYRKIIKSF